VVQDKYKSINVGQLVISVSVIHPPSVPHELRDDEMFTLPKINNYISSLLKSQAGLLGYDVIIVEAAPSTQVGSKALPLEYATLMPS